MKRHNSKRFRRGGKKRKQSLKKNWKKQTDMKFESCCPGAGYTGTVFKKPRYRYNSNCDSCGGLRKVRTLEGKAVRCSDCSSPAK